MSGRCASVLVRASAISLALAAVAAGCGHSAAARHLSDAELGALVLQPPDLPGVFQQFDEGRQLHADVHAGPRGDQTRFGRQGGWKARYKRPGSAATQGPLVVESRADVFGDDNGAKKDLAAYAEELAASAQTTGGSVVPAPKIGDEARALSVLQGPARSGVRTITIAWRHGRFTASLTANGFGRGLTIDNVAALARKQDARLGAG